MTGTRKVVDVSADLPFAEQAMRFIVHGGFDVDMAGLAPNPVEPAEHKSMISYDYYGEPEGHRIHIHEDLAKMEKALRIYSQKSFDEARSENGDLHPAHSEQDSPPNIDEMRMASLNSLVI